MKRESVERAMLEQTYRFGMGVPELGSLVPEIRKDASAALDVLDALSAAGYLGQAPLFGKLHYYFLADRAHGEFEIAEDEIGPLKEREKALRFAMLRFAFQSKPPQRPLTRSDFRDHFPDLYHASPHGRARPRQEPRFRDYYLAGRRLGLLRVDFGGKGRYDRILGRARRQLAKHQTLPAYTELVRRGAFELTIVTAFSSKAQRLRADLANQTTDAPITIRVVPELRDFLAPPESNG